MPHPETEVILGHRMRPARCAGRISPLCAPDPSPGAPLLMVRGARRSSHRRNSPDRGVDDELIGSRIMRARSPGTSHDVARSLWIVEMTKPGYATGSAEQKSGGVARCFRSIIG